MEKALKVQRIVEDTISALELAREAGLDKETIRLMTNARQRIVRASKRFMAIPISAHNVGKQKDIIEKMSNDYKVVESLLFHGGR